MIYSSRVHVYRETIERVRETVAVFTVVERVIIFTGTRCLQQPKASKKTKRAERANKKEGS